MANDSLPRRLFSPSDIARASKALVYCYGLTPAARRVGLALLDHLNVYSGRCDPGEARLAYMLHISQRQVRNAKAQLARCGFLKWQSHGGVNLTSDYRLNFAYLHAACDRIEADAKQLLPRRCRAGFQSGKILPVCETGNSVPETGNSLPPERKQVSDKLTHEPTQPIYQEALKEE